MVGTRGRSGGPRQGQQGKAYPNRTDLNAQPIRTAPGQPYGDAAAQAAAQAAVPLAQAQPVPSMEGPTTRPGEHVMTGAPMGPGPGPEILPQPQRNFAAQNPLTPRDRLQQLLQAGIQNGIDVSDLAQLVNGMTRG